MRHIQRTVSRCKPRAADSTPNPPYYFSDVYLTAPRSPSLQPRIWSRAQAFTEQGVDLARLEEIERRARHRGLGG
jgi:hypothetical protein